MFCVAPSKHLPLLIGRDFVTLARVVEDLGEKTLGIGTGVDNVVVSGAEHWAFPVESAELAQRSQYCG